MYIRYLVVFISLLFSGAAVACDAYPMDGVMHTLKVHQSINFIVSHQDPGGKYPTRKICFYKCSFYTDYYSVASPTSRITMDFKFIYSGGGFMGPMFNRTSGLLSFKKGGQYENYRPYNQQILTVTNPGCKPGDMYCEQVSNLNMYVGCKLLPFDKCP